MEETKIVYYIDDEDTPYLVKLPVSPENIMLSDLKNIVNRPNAKFFFKSMDDDFGIVKEELVEDDAKLPLYNGRVVSWVVSADGGMSDSVSQCTESVASRMDQPIMGDCRPTSYHQSSHRYNRSNFDASTTCTETDSCISSQRGSRVNGHRSDPRHRYHVNRLRHDRDYESSLVSSDIESTSFQDSDEEASSRMSCTTGGCSSSVSQLQGAPGGHGDGRNRRRRRKHRHVPISRTSSFSSISESTMSLNIITVTLNMDTVNFLGISIVGQSNKGGDGGIYVGSIMKGGAVALDGRIEPGDMILQVNEINFENMSNDEAVRVLREVVQKPGPIKLVVAKCWDPNPKGYFTIPRTEPVRPIDPGAWVEHTAAVRGDYPERPASVTTLTSTSSSISSAVTEIEIGQFPERLTVTSDMATIARMMASPESGLEIRDRTWLKITISNAIIGSDVVDWLFRHVEGFSDRRDAKKYAAQLLKAGYIKHAVNKSSFSEQCYYVFGDVCLNLASLKLTENNHTRLPVGSVSDPNTSRASYTLSQCNIIEPAPGIVPGAPGSALATVTAWAGAHIPYSGTYYSSTATPYASVPFQYTSGSMAFTNYGREGSTHSGSGGSSNDSERRRLTQSQLPQLPDSRSQMDPGSLKPYATAPSVGSPGSLPPISPGLIHPATRMPGDFSEDRGLVHPANFEGVDRGGLIHPVNRMLADFKDGVVCNNQTESIYDGVGDMSTNGEQMRIDRLMGQDMSASRQSFRMAMGNPLENDMVTYQFMDKGVV